MKFLRAGIAALTAAVLMMTAAACGEQKKENDSIKQIDRPETVATGDEVKTDVKPDAVELSENVNGKRLNVTLKSFTDAYNKELKRLGKTDQIVYEKWNKQGQATKDDNDVPIQYWYYDDEEVNFTASVEIDSNKLVNIGCGTTMSRFMAETENEKNSDIILGKAALMAECACGFQSGSESVLQDIFFRTTTGSNDTLWYKGYVFNLSTKENSSDSKKSVMLFRVFPITDELKKEWKLTEYK